MNSYELEQSLSKYPVTVCSADRIQRRKDRFVISNTDTSGGSGKHWVVLYFPERGPYEFFDSLGNSPEYYGVGFETFLDKKYLMCTTQLQQSTSNVCGLYCVYYVLKRCKGNTLRDIVKEFNALNKNENDRLIVSKLKTMLTKS